MAATGLDHVNVRTGQLAEMARFYEEIVGLAVGERPAFGVPGTWLYLDGQAVVHLVGMSRELHQTDPQIEHFAFRCRGLDRFLDTCRRADVPYYVAIVPGLEIRQVNIFDPDGNKVEMQFSHDDSPDADLSPFRMAAPPM